MTRAKNRQIPNDIQQILKSRYRDFSYLSGGGMGSIFTAHDTILDKIVAIKVLQTTIEERKAVVHFQREAKTASKLEHPNIVTTMDFGVSEKNQPYLIMDYIEGQSLDRILKQEGTLPLDVALEIILQLLRAVAYAHSQGIIHRDLKTSNVMIEHYPDSPGVKVIDFGLARLESQGDSSGRKDGLTTIKGTPLYMSPEQAAGQSGDERSDIYSIGCILFKLLTGHCPIEDEDTMTLLARKKEEDPASIRQSYPSLGIPRSLDETITESLKTEPASRIQSAEAFRKALDNMPTPVEEEIETAHVEDKKRSLAPKVSTIVYASITVLALLMVSFICVLIITFDVQTEKDTTVLPSQEPTKFKQDHASFQDNFQQKAVVAKIGVRDADLIELSKKLEQEREAFNKFKETAAFKKLSKEEKKEKMPDSSLDFHKSKVTGSTLHYLKNLEITRIDLSDSNIEDRFMQRFVEFKGLKTLLLDDTAITDDGLKNLSGSSIITLSLSGCKRITDRGIEFIARPPLENLTLSNTNVSDRGLKYLGACTSLKHITLDNTKVSERGIKALAVCKNVVDIKLLDCPNITGAILPVLAGQWNLNYLGLGNIDHTDEQFESLRTEDMVHFEGHRLELTDNDMKVVACWSRLRDFMSFSQGQFSDKGLTALYDKKKLKQVVIYLAPNVTKAGLLRLKERLPAGCHFMTDKEVDSIPEEVRTMIEKSQ